MIQLNYHNETKEKIDEDIFVSLLPKIAKKHPSASDKALDLTIVDDKQIHALNKEHRNKDCPTDVISFAFADSDDFPGENPLGEIYISINTAKAQSEEMGHSLEYEFKFLFVHGLLHLLGFTHDTEETYEEMMQVAEEIIGD